MRNLNLFVVLALSVSILSFLHCGKKKAEGEDESLMENELAEGAAAKTDTAAPPPPPAAEPAPKPAAPSADALFDTEGRYTVQVAVFPSQRAAERLAKKLEEKNWPAYVADVQDPKPELSGTYYRVRVGYFSGLSMAKEFADNFLSAEGYSYWLDNKANDHIAKSNEMEAGGSAPAPSAPASSAPTSTGTAGTWGASEPSATTPSGSGSGSWGSSTGSSGSSSGSTDSWNNTGSPGGTGSTGSSDWGSGSSTTPSSGSGTTAPATDDWGTQK